MKKLATALLVLVFVLLLVLVGRTLRFSSRQMTPPPAKEMRLDTAALVGRLSRAIGFRTISAANPRAAESEEFARFHQFLGDSFPHIAGSLEKEVIGGQSLLYTWSGQEPALKPILLMAHLDVVTAADKGWRHPPFAGAVADGYVWGRGTMDDKSSLMAMLEAVEHLLRDRFMPKRTLYLAFGHDEEVGGAHGTGLARGRRPPRACPKGHRPKLAAETASSAPKQASRAATSARTCSRSPGSAGRVRRSTEARPRALACQASEGSRASTGLPKS